MTDRTQITERFAGHAVTEAPVSASQAEALEELSSEVLRVHAGGQADAAAVRAGLAVARELTDRLRAGASPGARPQSRWTAFLVQRSGGGASLVVEDAEAGHAFEFRLSAAGLFTGGAWRGAGDDGTACLVAFRVTALGATRALATSDGDRQASSDLGALRLPPWAEEVVEAVGGGPGLGAFAAALGGLLANAAAAGGAEPAAPSSAPPPQAPVRAWSLVVTSGAAAGARFPFSDGAVIGRAAGCAIRLESKAVSRRHAELRRVDPGWQIVDLGSANGTWLNGARLSAPAALAPGDRVKLGEVQAVVEAGDAGAPTGNVATVLDMPVQREGPPSRG